VLYEAFIRRVVDGADVMRAKLQHIVQMADRRASAFGGCLQGRSAPRYTRIVRCSRLSGTPGPRAGGGERFFIGNAGAGLQACR
jgi:hypothetical protein